MTKALIRLCLVVLTGGLLSGHLSTTSVAESPPSVSSASLTVKLFTPALFWTAGMPLPLIVEIDNNGTVPLELSGRQSVRRGRAHQPAAASAAAGADEDVLLTIWYQPAMALKNALLHEHGWRKRLPDATVAPGDRCLFKVWLAQDTLEWGDNAIQASLEAGRERGSAYSNSIIVHCGPDPEPPAIQSAAPAGNRRP